MVPRKRRSSAAAPAQDENKEEKRSHQVVMLQDSDEEVVPVGQLGTQALQEGAVQVVRPPARVPHSSGRVKTKPVASRGPVPSHGTQRAAKAAANHAAAGTGGAGTGAPCETCQECEGNGTVAVPRALGIGCITLMNQPCHACEGTGMVPVSPYVMHERHSSAGGGPKSSSVREELVQALERGLDASPVPAKAPRAKASTPKATTKCKGSQGGTAPKVQANKTSNSALAGVDVNEHRRCTLCKCDYAPLPSTAVL